MTTIEKVSEAMSTNKEYANKFRFKKGESFKITDCTHVNKRSPFNFKVNDEFQISVINNNHMEITVFRDGKVFRFTILQLLIGSLEYLEPSNTTILDF